MTTPVTRWMPPVPPITKEMERKNRCGLSFPSITIMKHGTISSRTQEKMVDKDGFPFVDTSTPLHHSKRKHDPPICDLSLPGAVAQTLLLELGISKRHIKKHKIMIVCSPMRRCIETAVLVAQSIGLTGFSIHHELVDNLSNVRNHGWNVDSLDPHVANLILSREEIDEIVDELCTPWKYVNVEADPPTVETLKVEVENVFGEMLLSSMLPELHESHEHRVKQVFTDIQNSVSDDGEHVIIIAHEDSMNVFVQMYGNRELRVSNMKDCSFITARKASEGCVWIQGMSRCLIHLYETTNNKFLEEDLQPEKFHKKIPTKAEQLRERRSRQQETMRSQSAPAGT